MKVPSPYKKTTVAGGAAVLVLALVLIAVTSLFWGWLFMLIAGAAGWHIPLVPVGWLIGLGISLLFGSRS